MQKFATEYSNDEFLQGVLAKLSWNHNQMLLDKVKDKEQRKWYAKESIENGWSVSVLSHQIASKLYEDKQYLKIKQLILTKHCQLQVMNKQKNC